MDIPSSNDGSSPIANSTAFDCLFSPKTVAIVGASDNPHKLGGRPLSMSRQAGFAGTIYPVNARTDRVQGVPAVPTLGDLPGPVDCAILAVPQQAVEEQLEAAAGAGAKVAVVFASSYAEVGHEGAERQTQLAACAARNGIRLLGPNCMGAFDVRARFFPTFLQAFDHHGNRGWPEEGRVAIVSQSGAIGSHLFVMLRERGVGLSKFVTTGNQADLDVADCIAYLADDPETGVIAVYLEGIRDGAKLLQALAKAARNAKPVVILKVGGSRAGAAAISSHTASIAGDDEIADALFAAAGAHRARSLTELAERAIAFGTAARPENDRVGIFSLSGGGGVILADACDAAGLPLDPMPEAARKRMRDIVPFCAPANPVDPGAPAMTDANVTLGFLEIALDEGDYGTMFVFLTHLGFVDRMMVPVREGLKKLRQRFPDRLLVLILLCGPELRRELQKDGFLVFDEPLSAVAAVAALRRAPCVPALPEEAERSAGSPGPVADEYDARRLLRVNGVPVAPETLAHDAGEAAAAAAGYGVPCALKLIDPAILHKHRAGLVRLDVGGADAASAAFDELMAVWRGLAGRSEHPRGVLVSPMVGPGLELIIGARSDPALGTVVILGHGGLAAEMNGKGAVRLAPVDRAAAAAMIAELGVAERHAAHFADAPEIDALASAICDLSVLAASQSGRFESIEVNPFILGPGVAAAVDALVVARGVGEAQQNSET